MTGKILAVAAFVGLASSTAWAQEAPHYSARIQNACANLGLNPSEAPFLYCEMSLQDFAGSPAPARHVRVARDDKSLTAEWPSTAPLEGVNVYGSYQRGDQTISVKRACAEIGLTPGSAAYTGCTGDLNMTLDDSGMTGTD